jgi:hypothetical protein
MKTHYSLHVFLLFLCSAPFLAFSQTDQELVWGSYFGGSATNIVMDIKPFYDGGVVVLGRTTSLSNVATPGSHQMIHGGVLDVFVARFDENRNLLWSTYFGGSDEDNPLSMEVTVDGKIYIAGTTRSPNNISTPGAFIESLSTFGNGFLASFNETGILEWSTYLGGSAGVADGIYSMSLDSNGDIIVAGFTYCTDFPTTSEAMQTDFGGGSKDGIISKFSSQGELLWSTFFGGEGADQINNIKVNNNGDIIGVGETFSHSGIASPDAHKTELDGNQDMFLFSLNADGELIWATYYGGIGLDYQLGLELLTIDEEDNIYFGGTTNSNTGIATNGAYQVDLTTTSQLGNMFVAAFNHQGEQLWGTNFGSNGQNQLLSMNIFQNMIVIAGQAFPDLMLIAGSPLYDQVNSPSSIDAFMAAFSMEGDELKWGTFFGGNGYTTAYTVAAFGFNQLALGGGTSSSTNITTPDGYRTDNVTSNDAYIAFFQINYGTGVNENEVLPMSVFPNPSSGAVRLQLPASFAFMADVEVHDLSGKLVLSKEDFNAFDLLHLPQKSGMYIITCRNDKAVTRTKVIVE